MKVGQPMGRWLVLVTLAFALLAAASVEGIAQRALFSDGTGIVWVICAVALLGTAASRWRPDLNDWLCDQGMTLLLGLLGTVIGFMGAIEGAVEGNVATKLAGVETALSTTAVGLVAHIHLLIMQRVMK